MVKYPWNECIADQKADKKSDEVANKICGKIKARNSKLAQVQLKGIVVSASLDSKTKP